MKKAVVCVLLMSFSVFFGTAGLCRAEDTPGTLVSEGRSLLFNNGNPTYSGILAANEKFQQAVAQNPSDPVVKAEASFFYAVTRVLAFGLEEGGGGGFETLQDLFEAFGVTRSDNDYMDAGAPYNDPPQIYDHYDPPGTVPGGETVRQFLSESVVALLDGAIANLGVPTTTFNLVLTAVETGDESIEIDYGDVLLLRAALYAAKSALLIATAYDLDVDLRSLFVLANAEVIQIQRDLLDKYENLLALLGSGQTGSLLSAKLALRNAIGAYRDAIDFITNEEPYQDDDLFAFDSEDDRNAAEYLSVQLTEVESSLNQNRPATVKTLETWRLTNQQFNLRYELEIEKDANGDFLAGDFRGLDEPVWGDIQAFEVSSTVMLTVTLEGDCPGTATLTGGRSGNQIIGGVLSIVDCAGSDTEPFNGTLELVDTETLEIDFNRLFGSTGKAALDIRAVLPNFNTNDEVIIGTFPGSPVLNGIVSGLETNDDLTRELELEPANPNVASVSGTVTCNDHDGTGNIFIWAYDGPDPATARQLGNTYMAAPGAYTISDVPIGATVYLFGRWDADDNGIKTFGDLLGQGGPALVQAGGTMGVNFSIGTIIDDSFILTKPGVYRVFGSNTFVFPDGYYLGGDPNEIDWGSGWTFIGEGSGTRTLQTGLYFKTILIIWGDDASFYFDAIEDLTAGTAFATHADGTGSDYQWISSGLRNLDGEPWVWEPSYFKGHPDGLYAVTEDWAGFSLFTMPDDPVSLDTPRQLRLTSVSGFEAGLVGLSDVIVVLKVVAGLDSITLVEDADINGDGRVTLVEVIYALQRVALLR